MKTDIILAGVGGQGILSIAAAIGTAAVQSNLYLKQSEVHGMSQRGGDVQSHLRISDKPIASDLIPLGKGDIIISVEPMEALRYLPYLSKDGWIVTNTTPFINIPNYPEQEKLMDTLKGQKNVIAIDADAIAKDAGSARSANMVILGAASAYLNMPIEVIEKAIVTLFERKGQDIVDANLKAFNAGREAAKVK
ncbi:indolepyruvate oxidoreductase subunit beta [Acetobacteroides hydrogenigenes]|uniref:Indolepyruvate ferredoxin oxidoreductase beta subunit n=1 Tax=Acetobacteroides hydrogenigenes TaxID=979970 RepID=A0A4R2EH34_9BACT|nr:indolepyruvate oxidoreductase subunit beta [Acetobacteroides hydrogenigenes]TCN67721.1 indolepyruvate ferredoxin oxidoreductase beta subunit [Acetobacteroides hydrogenigenes]